MKSLFRGRFGVRDNSHAQLEWTGPTSATPELLGLTDKPPGSYGPGDRWWPSVGCGPIGDVWAVWWTVPDDTADRGGMARSEVAAWPRADVPAVGDLRGVLRELSGAEIPPASGDLVAAVAEALIAASAGRAVFVGLDLWPSVIASLWERLWPRARRSFSARVAVSPPQATESVAPPWIFGVPVERAQQWTGWHFVGTGTSNSRGARWLAGADDEVLGGILHGVDLGSDLSRVRRASRAADKVEAWRAIPDGQRALEALRSLIALAPAPLELQDLKSEVLQALTRALAGGETALVFAVANIPLGAVEAVSELPRTLQRWVRLHAPFLGDADMARCLSLLSAGRAEEWWAGAVREGLRSGLEAPDAQWAGAALGWLSTIEPGGALEDLLPRTSSFEGYLLAAAHPQGPGRLGLERVRARCVARGWSRLHAWASSCLWPPVEALSRQRAFPGDPLPGLAYLVGRLPAETVVEDAVSSGYEPMFSLVAERTVREPRLLGSLDVGEPGWRRLWAAHVKAGGHAWPPGVDIARTGSALLGLALERVDVDELLSKFAGDLGTAALSYPRRAELWQAIRTPGRDVLLEAVAVGMVALIESGAVVESPERVVADAVVARARRAMPSTRLAVAVLRWDVGLDEGVFDAWLRARRPDEWREQASLIGEAVSRRRWGRVARTLYEFSATHRDFLPAARATADLLPWWERTVLSWHGGDEGAVRPLASQDLAERLGNLGSDLAPDRLDDLWERAGGSRKKLPFGTDPGARWRAAARLAVQGGLEDGLEGLLAELREDFPYNADLRQLAAVMKTADRKW